MGLERSQRSLGTVHCNHTYGGYSVEEDEEEDHKEATVGEEGSVGGDNGHQDGHDGDQCGVQETPGEPVMQEAGYFRHKNKLNNDVTGMDHPLYSPEGSVIQPHHGHSVFKTLLLLSSHIDD